MSVPAGVIRIVVQGSFPQGEVFAFGMWFTDPGVLDQAGLDGYVGAFITRLSGQVNAWSILNNSDSSITQVSGYAYTDGSGQARIVSHVPVSTIHGTAAGANLLPLQCSLVVSLRTAINGRRFRGRFYVPVTASVLPLHQVTTGVATSLVNAWGTIFNDFATDPAPSNVVVVSSTGSVTTPVNQLQVDTRVDIQRRRANKQAIVGVAVSSL